MRVCQALAFAALIVVLPFAASAQFGGMPGMPGLPGGPLTPPRPPLPPACQQLLTSRDEIQKHGTAIQEANKRKASVHEACQLFKSFLSAEAKFVNSLEENSQTCGVPADAIKQVKEGHAKAGQVGKQVCDAAARAPRGYEDCNICGKMGDWGPLVR